MSGGVPIPAHYAAIAIVPPIADLFSVSLNEDLLNTEDFPWDEAHEMIDSGAAKEQLRYSLEGGTLVVVYAIAEKPEAETAAG